MLNFLTQSIPESVNDEEDGNGSLCFGAVGLHFVRWWGLWAQRFDLVSLRVCEGTSRNDDMLASFLPDSSVLFILRG